MDDLTFRRAVLADPTTNAPEIVTAAQNNPELAKFWLTLKQQELALKDTLSVPVLVDLADKLLWHTQAQEDKTEQSNTSLQHTSRSALTIRNTGAGVSESSTKEKTGKPWYLAAAASILLAVSVFMINTQSNDLNLYQDALAHIQHAAEHELADAGEVTLADINAKLASLHGVLNASVGKVLSVNFCSLDGVRSLHVMVGNKENPTSLFILPKNTTLDGVPTTASTAATIDFADAKVLVMGEVAETVQSLKAQVKAHLKFTIHD